MSDYQKYLDPTVLDQLDGLELKARRVVEGFISGMHESPYRGVSVEFAQHREYVPGDDLRHLDWNVYARSDRLYIKEYEQETNLRVTPIVDLSESMEYTSHEITKIDYARYVAASLAYLVIEQQDGIGLTTFNRELTNFLEPSNSTAHFHSILKLLSNFEPHEKTDMGRVLNHAASRMNQRGLIILISDLFDDADNIAEGLSNFRHREHDVIVLQILDPAEVEFPFDEMTRFKGMEIPDELLADPKALRQAYLDEINQHNEKIKKTCLDNQMDYRLIRTDESLDVALSTYLARRMGILRRAS